MFVRIGIVIIALAGFVPQLFVCCAGDRGASADPAVAVEEHSCSHHHDGEDEPTESPHHDHPHHLCVATHLFYVVRVHDAAPQPSLNLLEAVRPVAEVATDAKSLVGQTGTFSFTASPPSALKLRAELGVWTI